MKLSLNWLNDFVKHGLSADKLAERLTMAGHEVKGVDDVGGDKVFEIEITPNRPDCLNTLGLAREVSAIVNKPLRTPKLKLSPIPKAFCDVTIEDRAACLRYIGSVVENVTVADSSPTIKARLQAVGLRPINNVVDTTNYGLFENGQPLHAFDYDKLIGGKIIVRRAKAGEKIVTLDGVERELNPAILVIADAQRPVALAGIMGGQAAEVTAQTKNILLESAYFDPILIRRAGRALGLTSDSAYRFERGVDFVNVDIAAKRALSRIVACAGGKIIRYRDLFFHKASSQKSFAVDVAAISHFLGTKILATQAKKILSHLGFLVTGKSYILNITAPSFRNDIKGAVDISEEVARIIGYDRLPSSLPQIKPSAIVPSLRFQLKRKLRRILTGLGLDEAMSYPLISAVAIERTKVGASSALRIKNPLSSDQEFLRPSLLASLLAVVNLNFNRGQKNLRLFELGKIYSVAGEKEVLGIILTGSRLLNWQTHTKEPVDFYDLKGMVGRVFEGLGFEKQDKVLSLNKIGKDVLKNWDLKSDDVYYAEIDLEALYKLKPQSRRFSPLSAFPSITRDVSLAVRPDVTFAQIESLAREHGGKYLIAVNFLEQYLGEKIAAGQKGLVFSLLYQSSTGTLTEAQIAPVHEQILQKFIQDLGAAIR